MSAARADGASQEGFGVRLCWGPAGVRALARPGGVMVLVDILRFTTALDVAVAAGARVFPAPWPHDPNGTLPAGTELADGRGPHSRSLSPASLTSLEPGDRIMLPSANGSHCSALAARVTATVIGGSLRNGRAVAEWIVERTAASGAPVCIVACGEQWPDGSLRPAVEDLVGAGALVDALTGANPNLTVSPEATAAAAAFRAVADQLGAALGASVSGRELRAAGKGDDIVWAAAGDVSACVPVLGPDGSYQDRPPA